MRLPLPRWVRDAMLACAGGVAFYLLHWGAHSFWYLPAGARFATLLFLPVRSWPWFLAVSELLFVPEARTTGSVATFELDGLILFAAACSGPLWLRSSAWSIQPMRFAAMARLIAAMALSALLCALFNPFVATFVALPPMPWVQLHLRLLFGDFIGMLVLVPPCVMLLQARPNAVHWRRWRVDVPLVLIPALLLYVGLNTQATQAQVYFLLSLLVFVPSIYFAVRSGWRGAALALAVSSVTVACYRVWIGHADSSIESQGLLAIAGSAALLLGASRDALVRNQQELEIRHAHLAAAYARQDRLTAELQDAARRNLEMAEELRRGITAELHDEIGQNLAAVQARVRLLERKAGAEGGELAAEIATTLTRMRHAVSGLLSSLRPAGLDDFGLVHALREGTIRSTVESAALIWDLRIDDEDDRLDRLDDGTRTALYRIIQEFATNTVRHAQARRLRVRLRARDEATGTRIVLALADDGHGFASNRNASGIGLVGIHDRVRAIGAHMRLRNGAFGTRLWVRVHLPGGG
ncbi:MAG: MASE1 domain-containing protein [Proteobacteria bacterium]|nr:MASE1 domain-containing protein [Pseudomonadota bacterium]